MTEMIVSRAVNETRAGELPPQVHIGTQPMADGFRMIDRNDRLPWRLKPSGGLWTSSLNDQGTTGWVDWCRGEDFGGVDVHDWWLLVPQPDVRVLVIDSPDDLMAVVDAFPLDTGYTSEYMPSRLVDFGAMIDAGIAGLRLTAAGHWATRYHDIHGLNTYSWDCESTVWLTWCFERVDLFRTGGPA